MKQKQKDLLIEVWRQFEKGGKEGSLQASRMKVVDVGPDDVQARLQVGVMVRHVGDLIGLLVETKNSLEKLQGASAVLDLVDRSSQPRAKALSSSSKKPVS